MRYQVAKQECTQEPTQRPMQTAGQLAQPVDPPPRGFTVPELMVVVGIVALLASQAVPAVAKSWEGVMYSRIANSLLVLINGVRQQAITNEQDTLIEFTESTWCARFAEAEAGSCGLGFGELPANFKFYPTSYHLPSFFYSAGRGFSPLSSGSMRLGNANSHSSRSFLNIYNSSVGRVRVCGTVPYTGIPTC